MQFTVKIEGLEKLQKNLDSIRKGLGGRAVAMALNKTAGKAKTTMKQAIAETYEIPKGIVGGRLRVIKASSKFGKLRSVLTVRGKRSLNTIRFLKNKGRVQSAIRRGKRPPQLLFKIKRGGVKKPIKGAFLGNSGRTVFQRVGKARHPIKPVQTIGVPQAFASRRINQRVIARIRKELPVEVDRAVAQVLRKFK